MPHVIVDGPCSVEQYYTTFRSVVRQDRGMILKTMECFLGSKRTEALVDSVVVEGGRPQQFFIWLIQRDGGVIVRLLPATDPEKTEGIKRLIVHVAAAIKAQHPDCRYGNTNLQGYVKE